MSRSKKLGVLLGVLGVVCLAALGAMHLEERREQIKNSGEVILALDSTSVEALSWDYEGNTLSFQKEDSWQYAGDPSFPVSEEKLMELLDSFQSLTAALTIENPEDLSQYGLDSPVCTISLTAQETYQISLGDYSSLDAKRYLSIGDGNVYLVEDDPMDVFCATLQELIENDEAPYFDAVTSLRFSGEETYQIDYQADSTDSYCAGDVYFTKREGKNLPLDTEKVENYLWAIENLSLTDYVSYNATDDELKTYGLDDPDLTVTVDYTTEDADHTPGSFTLQISRDPKEKDDEENAAAYVRVGDSPILYKISSSDYTELTAVSYDTLRHTELFWGDFADVQQLDITTDGTAYSITSEASKDGRKYSYEGAEVSLDTVQSKLEALCAESFLEETPSQKKELSLTLHLDNQAHPTVRLDLYRYNGTHCLAAVDGTPVALVSRSNAVALIEAIHAIVLN